MNIINKLNTLNGWERIGVILSVLWFFYGGLNTTRYYADLAFDKSSASYEICKAPINDYSDEKGFKKLDQCSKDRDKNYAMWLDGTWLTALIVAILPIPIVWYLISILIKLYKWTSAGFQKDTRKKK